MRSANRNQYTYGKADAFFLRLALLQPFADWRQPTPLRLAAPSPFCMARIS
jgi:hypothetical protein